MSYLVFKVLDSMRIALVNLFKSFILVIAFIFEVGIGNLLALLVLGFVLFYFIGTFFNTVILFLAIAIAVIGAIFLIVKIYQREGRKYAEQRTSEIVSKAFQMVESELKEVKSTEGAIVTSFEGLTPISNMNTLEDKLSFYEERHHHLSSMLEKMSEPVYGHTFAYNQNNFLIERIKESFNQRTKGDFDLIHNYPQYHDQFTYVIHAALTYYYHQFRIIHKGVMGERRMAHELNAFIHDFKVLSNVVLKFEGKSFETDFLVFSRHGIFSLEVKNVGESGKYAIRITPDGQWLKVFKSKTEPFQDVSSQVNFHLSMTEKILNKYKQDTGKEIPNVKPVIIIANNNVLIENEGDAPVYRVNKFISHMREQKTIIDEEDMNNLYNWYQSFEVDTKKYEALDYVPEIQKSWDILEDTRRNYEVYMKIIASVEDQIKKETRLHRLLSK